MAPRAGSLRGGHLTVPTRIIGAAVAACLAAAACTAGGGDGRVTVLAASSLAEAFRALEGPAASAGIALDFSFAGSQVLLAQIRQGVPADVVAVADARQLEPLAREGRIVGEAVVFARNRLVVVVGATADVPVRSVEDLARSGVRVVLAAENVPAGRYALEGLDELGLRAEVLARVVSHEDSVTAVGAKVALGEADAGIVYVTDARADDRLRVVGTPLPVTAEYAAAVLEQSDEAEKARRFVALLRSAEGQAVLARMGFTSP